MRCITYLALGQQLKLLEIVQLVVTRQIAKATHEHKPLIPTQLYQIAVQFAQLKLRVALFIIHDGVRGHGADHHHKA